MCEGTAGLTIEGGPNVHVILAMQAVARVAEILAGGSGGSVERQWQEKIKIALVITKLSESHKNGNFMVIYSVHYRGLQVG